MSDNALSLSGNDDQLEKLKTLAEDRLSFGAQQADVAQQLVEMGMGESAATGMVTKIARRIAAEKGESVPLTPSSRRTAGRAKSAAAGGDFSMPFVVGVSLLAALIGAFIWSAITNMTGYELGLVAWGIGGLVGLATATSAGHSRDGRLPIVAVVASIFGILMGKYLAFLHMFNDFSSQVSEMSPDELLADLDISEAGLSVEELAAFQTEIQAAFEVGELSFFNGIPTFIFEYGMNMGLFDLLWIFLAVSTAYRIAGEFSD